MKWLRYFVIFISCTSSLCHAANRNKAVLAAYRILPVLLEVVAQTTEYKRLDVDEKWFYNEIQALAESQTIPIEFDPLPENFNVNEGENTRWMRIEMTKVDNDAGETSTGSAKIYVNERLLNAPETIVSLPVLLQILVHELGHEVDVKDLGWRDRMARFFFTQVSRYVRESKLPDGGRLEILSIPEAQVDKEFGPTPGHRAQPTNVILVEREGRIADFSEVVQTSLDTPSTVMRSLWAEANLAIYSLANGFSSMFARIVPMMNEMGEAFRQAVKAKYGFDIPSEQIESIPTMDIRELRVLELMSAQSVASGDDIYVRIKANFHLSRTGKQNADIFFNGAGDNFMRLEPVPLSILLRLSHEDSLEPKLEDVQISLRPKLTTDISAKIKTVVRSPLDQRIAVLPVEVEADSVPDKVYLSAMYVGGSRQIEATAVKSVGPRRWLLEFNIPWRFLPGHRHLIVESLIWGSTKTVYLDRLISLNEEEEDHTPSISERPQFVENSVGLWATQKGDPVFINEFKFGKPIHLVPYGTLNAATLTPSQIDIQFDLLQPAKVREVRLHLKRTSALLETEKSQDDESASDYHILAMNWTGQDVPIASGGTLLAKRDDHEILISRPQDIYVAETESGLQRVKIRVQAPFIPAGEPATSSQGHHSPLVQVVMLEVVFEDGRTLVHYFGSEVDLDLSKQGCGDALKSMFEGALRDGTGNVNFSWGFE